MSPSIEQRIADFVSQVTAAMGLSLEATIEQTENGPRVNLEGDDGGALLARRGEPLQALQQIVDAVFRDEMERGSRVLVDCMRFRRDKDVELRQMAKFLVEKVKASGADEQIGPLNAYERRIVHLAVAEDPAVASESVGDAAQKTVIISKRTGV